jgi:hypothetical protein
MVGRRNMQTRMDLVDTFATYQILSGPECHTHQTLANSRRHLLIASRVASHLGCLDGLSWAWEWSADAVNKHDWFVLIRDAVMHQGAVPVLLDVGSKSLALLAPHCLTWLLALDSPSSEV